MPQGIEFALDVAPNGTTLPYPSQSVPTQGIPFTLAVTMDNASDTPIPVPIPVVVPQSSVLPSECSSKPCLALTAPSDVSTAVQLEPDQITTIPPGKSVIYYEVTSSWTFFTPPPSVESMVSSFVGGPAGQVLGAGSNILQVISQLKAVESASGFNFQIAADLESVSNVAGATGNVLNALSLLTGIYNLLGAQLVTGATYQVALTSPSATGQNAQTNLGSLNVYAQPQELDAAAAWALDQIINIGIAASSLRAAVVSSPVGATLTPLSEFILARIQQTLTSCAATFCSVWNAGGGTEGIPQYTQWLETVMEGGSLASISYQ